MRNAFVNTIIDAVDTRDDLYIISGDAGLGVFDTFKDKHPDRFLNLGAAEQNMISFAAGLAISGFKVMIYNIIPFVLYRCYEQVRNDICYQELPIVLVGIGSGVTYAPMGMTHYSVEDLGIAQTLPNLVTISPIDPVEAKIAAKYALNANSPVYVRLAKRGEPAFHTKSCFDITQPQIIREGNSKIAILFHGSISNEVLSAYEILKCENITPTLISVPTIQPLDTSVLNTLLSEIKYVISVEEHFVTSGLGSLLAKCKVETDSGWSLKTLGIPFKFIHDVRNTDGMRSKFGITSSDIIRAVYSCEVN